FNILLDAMAILKKQQIHIYNKLNIILTFNKGMTKFGDFIIFECERRGLQNIHFIGLKSKEKLDDIYRNETDALIFPSKLETWGLPLSEAIACF
ncbi:glycosyltransferase, partial [Citrobacter freundii]|uniref:glycosyltransferase n=1 Tax=Citrobacter freundii TaxID=546 RepID=UPI000FDBF4B7